MNQPLDGSSASSSSQAVCVLVCVFLFCGCAQRFSLPMTAADLLQHDSGAALVAYLGQPDADPMVCDRHAPGPHLSRLDGRALPALVRGLTEGQVAPTLWLHCAAALLRSGSSYGDSASLFDAVADGYRKLITASDFEKSAILKERLRILQRLYTDREPGPSLPVELLGKRFAELRRALAEHRLGPSAASFATDLLTAFDLEHGRWFGRAVDLQMIDDLFSASNEKTLLQFVHRLPSSALRDAARRRIIRLRIPASPFPEVRDHPDRVEETVMKHGVNVIALADNPLVRVFQDETRPSIRRVLVRQQLLVQKATLLGYKFPAPCPDVQTEVRLQDWLMIEVRGISRAVTVCDPSKELDLTPCISAEDVRLEHPLVFLGKNGAFRFASNLPMNEAVSLTSLHGRLAVPVSVGGQKVLTFEWPLSFERPEDLILVGPSPGGPGPTLTVVVDHRDPAYFVFTVAGSGGPYLAVTESRDVAAFRIASQGADGITGRPGYDGIDGGAGFDCADGEDGEDGGPGDRGGSGGKGGYILVGVNCGAGPCDEIVSLLRQTMISVGGQGGLGGRGGRGGKGGAGGAGQSGSSYTNSDGQEISSAGCGAGTPGKPGARGARGAQGPAGRAGKVSFATDRPLSEPSLAAPKQVPAGSPEVPRATDSSPQSEPKEPPPAPLAAAVAPETLVGIAQHVEQAVATKKKELAACHRDYERGESAVIAQLVLRPTGTVAEVRLDRMNSSLSICIERILKTIRIAPFPDCSTTTEVRLWFSDAH